MIEHPRILACTLIATFVVACRDDDPDADDNETVTYWRDVAPIVMERCAGCHTAGGIAPFRLDTYEDAAPWAEAAAVAVANRDMPPWLVTADGSCGQFDAPEVLDEDEIAVFEAWARDGAAQGEPRTDLVAPPPDRLADAASYWTPEFTPMAVGGELAQNDEYRCFAIDPELDTDAFVTAFEVVPGNTSIVHHVLVFNVTPDMDVGGRTNLDVMDELDAQSPDREGWPCFGAAGEGVAPSGLPIVWAPGTGATWYPDGTGARLSAGDLLVAQVHYNMSTVSEPQSDRSEIRVEVAPSVEREGFMLLPDPFLDSIFGDAPASLPPGQAATDYTWQLPIAATLQPGVTGYELHGVLPHMHERGRQMRMEVLDATGSTCAAEVPAWDFHWQRMYFYASPIVVGPQHTLQVTCTYDTRDATEPVMPGWGTRNEMCLMGMFVVPTT